MFKEPSWNNPVVRFIAADKSDLVNKIRRDWSTKKLVSSMVETLKAAKKEVPLYLSYLNNDFKGIKSAGELTKLAASPLRFIPLSLSQAAAVEKTLKAEEDPVKHLSPTQRKILELVKKSPETEWPDVKGKDFLKGWNEFANFYSKQVKK